MGNSANLQSTHQDGVSGLKLDSGSMKNTNVSLGELEDGSSTIPEVTTQAASFARKVKKQVSFDEVPLMSAKDMNNQEELVLSEGMNAFHPNVLELARKYPAPIEIMNPASETSTSVYRFKKTGSTYQGEVLDGRPNGLGIIATKKGGMIQGSFDNGAMKGLSRIIDPSGTVYIGYIENRLKNGKGFYRESGGCNIEAFWQNGVTNGFVVVKTPGDDIIFQGSTISGRRHGYGKLNNRILKYTYEGEFKNDLFDGHGKKIFQNGKVYTGGFKSGIEQGYGELLTIDGRTIKANFIKGVPKGHGILVTDRQQEKKIVF